MDIENRLVVAGGEGVGGRIEWEVEVSRCRLLYTEWINNKVLGFPAGAVVKNPPANAGDMGLIPGPGRSHVPWSN